VIRVAVLGSTGSIGRSALEVIGRHADRFEVAALVANTKARELEAQVRRFRPARAVLCDDGAPVPTGTDGTTWASGWSALLDVAADPDVDVVVNALVFRAWRNSPRLPEKDDGAVHDEKSDD